LHLHHVHAPYIKGENKDNALFPDIYYSPNVSITVNRLRRLTTKYVRR